MNMQDTLRQHDAEKKKKEQSYPSRKQIKILTHDEAHKLIDMDEVTQEAVQRAEQSGIIFIDEIDKIARKNTEFAQMFREKGFKEIFFNR